MLDGRPLPGLGEGEHDGVAVLYARRGGPDAADDRLVGLVDADAAPARLGVVTSDRRLAARVRALGAGVEGASALLARLDELDGTPRR